MATKEELKQVLRELNEQGDVPAVKARAAELLRGVDAHTLSLAEQELEQEGMDDEALRKLCAVHLEVLGEGLEQQRPEVAAAHPIGILMDEHKIILQNLEELREISDRVRAAASLSEIEGQLPRLKAISHLLLDTESHHRREEETIFPRLESYGVTGPPRIMRQEHEELRAKKRRLAELVEQAGSTSYEELAKELAHVGHYIATTLKDHIYKEDNILYPTALSTLEPEEWPEVLKEFEGIGYCCFTPHGAAGGDSLTEG